jgi:tetraacyldisaccharide 4'-kinase
MGGPDPLTDKKLNRKKPLWKRVWNKERGLSEFVLFPFTLLAAIYGLSCRLRIFLYDIGVLPQKRAGCYVISIGNLTVGGTGKTPFTIHLAQKWKENGYTIGVVSRGYGGNYKDPVVLVSDGTTLLEKVSSVGDEPYLMAERLKGIPIVVAADRFRGCQWLIEHFKVDVILLDDGFQHLRLYRNLNLLLVDATNPFGNGCLLPRGSLREPVSEVRRADLVIFTRSENGSDATEWISEIERFGRPCIRSTFQPTHLFQLQTGSVLPLTDLKDQPILCFSGIGNPDSFARLLTFLGAEIKEQLIFGDHHPYQGSDWIKIKKKVAESKVKRVVTTEKDAVKIKEFLPADFEIWVLRVEVAFWEGAEKWQSLLFQKREPSFLQRNGNEPERRHFSL